jgi:hypothetical protein
VAEAGDEGEYGDKGDKGGLSEVVEGYSGGNADDNKADGEVEALGIGVETDPDADTVGGKSSPPR